LEKVEVANDDVAKALVPEKVLLFARSVDDAAVMVYVPPRPIAVPLSVIALDVETSLPVASVERTALVRPVNQVLPVKVASEVVLFEILRSEEKVDEACEMRPFWKVAIFEKVEVANDDVANALVPEKVLLSERSVVEAPVVGHALRQSPLTQSVLAEKTDDDALPKVARPVNHD